MGRRGRSRVLKNSLNIIEFVDACCQTLDFDFNTSCQLQNLEVCLGNNEACDCLNTLMSFLKNMPTVDNVFAEIINTAVINYNLTVTNIADLFSKIFETLKKHYDDVISDRNRVIEEYDENLMISQTELVELKKNLQDLLNRFYTSKAEKASLQKLLKNSQLNKDSKLVSLELKKLELNQCITDQKKIIEEMSDNYMKTMKELESIKEEKRSLEVNALKLQIENKDLLEKNEIINAHIFCEADSSQDSRHSACEIIENMCALQAEKHALECKNFSNEKTINYLRQQLNEKALAENNLREQCTDSLRLADSYQYKLMAREKQYSELLQHLESSKTDISSLNKELMMISKLSQRLQQEKNDVTKEINYCLSNLKQLNCNLEDGSQSFDADKLTPFMIALQIKFSNPLIQCLVDEMKKLFLHMRTSVNFINGLIGNYKAGVCEKKIKIDNTTDGDNRYLHEPSVVTSSSDNKNLKTPFMKARNLDSSVGCKSNNSCQKSSNEMQKKGRSSHCKFTVYKNISNHSDDSFNNVDDDKSCKVQ